MHLPASQTKHAPFAVEDTTPSASPEFREATIG